jgi:hypothetical protein
MPSLLHAPIEEFAANGYTHVKVLLPAMPRDPVVADELSKISMGLTLTSQRANRISVACSCLRQNWSH